MTMPLDMADAYHDLLDEIRELETTVSAQRLQLEEKDRLIYTLRTHIAALDRHRNQEINRNC